MFNWMKALKGRTEGEGETAVKERPVRAVLTAAAVLVLAVTVLILSLVSSHNKRRDLEAALSEAEQQLALREDVVTALETQQEEQQTLIQELQGKLEDFLNVKEEQPVITRDQIQERLATLRELVTQRYIYTNAARREDSKTWLMDWTLPFSESSLLLTYDGEIKAGIDFGALQVEVDEEKREITVTVPPSKVVDNVIPQESINVLEVKDGLFNKITFDEYNQFIGAEKPLMEAKAVEMGLLQEADREAKLAIRTLLELIPGMDTYKLTVK